MFQVKRQRGPSSIRLTLPRGCGYSLSAWRTRAARAAGVSPSRLRLRERQ